MAAGAQPSVDDFIELKNEGYDVIFNISPYSTRNAIHNEAEIIEKIGLFYVHFPIDCSNLKPLHYNGF
ncbi:MAG: hypothetical protein Q7U47_12020 [Paludibacter sp.]|nr:hypothetical protein [Paludibacter sp.]